jgi:toxin FitB
MLLDSNIIIYSAEPQYQQIRDLITRTSPAVSAISYVEVLGFPRITSLQIAQFTAFFANAPVFKIDRPILDQAVLLRQQRRMSVADAIIAATALVHGKTLVTRNTADFSWIVGLKLLDPLAAPPPPSPPQP